MNVTLDQVAAARRDYQAKGIGTVAGDQAYRDFCTLSSHYTANLLEDQPAEPEVKPSQKALNAAKRLFEADDFGGRQTTDDFSRVLRAGKVDEIQNFIATIIDQHCPPPVEKLEYGIWVPESRVNPAGWLMSGRRIVYGPKGIMLANLAQVDDLDDAQVLPFGEDGQPVFPTLTRDEQCQEAANRG